MTAFPYDVLGIEPGADERAIKRAFAAKLKKNRPDEDLNAFTRLVEARDLAMRLLSEVPATADAVEPEPRPAASPSEALPQSSLSDDADDRDLQELRDMLQRLTRPTRLAEIADWDALLLEMEKLSIGRNLSFQDEIIRASNEWLGTLGKSPEQELALLNLIDHLAQRLGWLSQSSRVPAILPWSTKREPLVRLLGVVAGKVDTNRKTSRGIPILCEFDIRSYFGGASGSFMNYYVRALRRGWLSPSWYLPAFFSPAVALIKHGFFLHSLLLIILVETPGVVLLRYGDEPNMHIYKAGYCALVLGVHIGYALFLKRMLTFQIAAIGREATRIATPYRTEERFRAIRNMASMPSNIVAIAGVMFLFTADLAGLGSTGELITLLGL